MKCPSLARHKRTDLSNEADAINLSEKKIDWNSFAKAIATQHVLNVWWIFHIVHDILMTCHSGNTFRLIWSPQIECEIIGARNEWLNAIRAHLLVPFQSSWLIFCNKMMIKIRMTDDKLINEFELTLLRLQYFIVIMDAQIKWSSS